MGRVARVEADRVAIDAGEAHRISPLKAGDGVVFDAADWRSPEEPEEGGRVYEVSKARDGRTELRFGNSAVRFDRIRAGDRVWRTHDPELDRVARPYLDPVAPVAKQPVNVRVIAKQGEPLIAAWSLAKRPEVEVDGCDLGTAGSCAESRRDGRISAGTIRAPRQHAV